MLENQSEENSEKNYCLIIYILYLCAMALPPLYLVGLIAAYIFRGDAKDWLKTHYSFQIRTFWWGLLFGFIGWLLVFILIGYIVLFVLLVWNIARAISGIKLLNRAQGLADFESIGFIAK